MARPPLPDHERKRPTTVWMSADEVQRVDAKASAAGVSRAEFLRQSALGQRVVAAAPEANRMAWAQLARTTSNLNQLVYHLNAGGQTDPDNVRSTVEQLRDEVATLRRELIGGDR
jgi:hypothetical protein